MPIISENIYQRCFYRSWEQDIFYSDVAGFFSIGKFYPSTNLMRGEQGDLAHGTKYQVNKFNQWKTDKYGFRNNNIPSKIDVLFIGDSNIPSPGIDQQDIIVNQFSKITGLSCYGINANINYVFYLLENNVVPKPRFLIHLKSEHNIISLDQIEYTNKFNINNIRVNIAMRVNKRESLTNGIVLYDKILKFPIIRKINAKVSVFLNKPNNAIHTETFLINDTKYLMSFSSFNEKDYFLDDSLLINRVYPVVHENYKKLKAMGITYLVVPIPNKETVFYNSRKMIVTSNKSISLDLFEIFEDNKTLKLLYQEDDTHLNKSGIALLCGQLKNLLN